MAASNRPDITDPTVLRPGRLDKVIYIDLPNESDRIEILQALTKKRTKPNLAEDVSFEHIACSTSGFTGADLAGLVRQASILALKDSLDKPKEWQTEKPPENFPAEDVNEEQKLKRKKSKFNNLKTETD